MTRQSFFETCSRRHEQLYWKTCQAEMGGEY